MRFTHDAPQIHRFLEAEGRCFRPDFRGLVGLCAAKPHLCQHPAAQRALFGLERRRKLGRRLIMSGIGGAMVGAGLSVWTITDAVRAERHHETSKPGPAKILPGPLLGLAGLGVTLYGLTLIPTDNDVDQMVDLLNQGHESPEILWGLAPSPRGDGLYAGIKRRF